MAAKYAVPRKGAKAFHCPHCGVYAQQNWYKLAYGSFGRVTRFDALPKQFSLSTCASCQRNTMWYDDRIVYPAPSTAPLPSADMPAHVRSYFMEAREIVNASPRAAAALLRIALHQLLSNPTGNGGAPNGDMVRMMQKGLPLQIQQALDSVRVSGRDAVYPGQIDPRDDANAAMALFELVNMLVEKMITEPNRIQEVYGRVAESKRISS